MTVSNDDSKKIPVKPTEVVPENANIPTDSGSLGTFVVAQEIQKALELLRLIFKFSEAIALAFPSYRDEFERKRTVLKLRSWHKGFQEINYRIKEAKDGEEAGIYDSDTVKTYVDGLRQYFAKQISSQSSKKSDLIYLVLVPIFFVVLLIVIFLDNPRIKEQLFDNFHSDSTALDLPLKQCGRSYSDTPEVWHPVWVDEADEAKLSYLKKNYCKHAYFKGVDNRIVQVAAFKSQSEANELVKMLNSDLRAGNARVGKAFRHPQK